MLLCFYTSMLLYFYTSLARSLHQRPETTTETFSWPYLSLQWRQLQRHSPGLTSPCNGDNYRDILLALPLSATTRDNYRDNYRDILLALPLSETARDSYRDILPALPFSATARDNYRDILWVLLLLTCNSLERRV